MDLLTKLGGRKFLMTLLVLGVAIFLEARTERGLTPVMAGFMVTLVGSFHVANSVVSSKFMSSKGAGGLDPSVNKKLEALSNVVQQNYDPDASQKLIALLSNLTQGINDVKSVAGQIAQASVNHTRMLQGLNGRKDF